MKVIKARNYEEMSLKAAQLIISKIHSNERMTLGLATGSTPTGVYGNLIRDHIDHRTSYQKITTVNLDEYIGLSPTDPNSYRYYMDQNLFDHINIPKEQTHLPNGMVQDQSKECARYDRLIKELGGIDLQLLGIGQNGHIGFNEPGSSFESGTHVVKLAESTIKANSRFFHSIEDVPTYALTMGIGSILESKEIILVASGVSKAKAISRLIMGEVDQQLPASALKLHPNVTLIADQDALQLVNQASF